MKDLLMILMLIVLSKIAFSEEFRPHNTIYKDCLEWAHKQDIKLKKTNKNSTTCTYYSDLVVEYCEPLRSINYQDSFNGGN